jgi:threonine dehydratase
MNIQGQSRLQGLRKEVLEAEKRVRKHIRETPLEFSPYLSRSGGCNVYLKLENMQVTGSFKLRGIMNKLLSLSPEQRNLKILTASTGNHGAAFAYAIQKLGMKGAIFLPENASQIKIEALRYSEVELKFHGTDCVQAEAFARETAEKNSHIYISPYNDIKIIAGHGTIGIELQKQARGIDAILAPVGGGGLISGITAYLKPIKKDVEMIGCQPENSAVMYESIKAGKIVEMESKPTISDGTAGGIEKGSITFDICKSHVDDFLLVTEEEIKRAVKLLIEKHSMLVEGSGALSVASYLKVKEKFKNKNVVLVISGARIGLEQLRELLSS